MSCRICSDHRNRRQYLKALALSPHFKTPVPDFDHPVRVLDAETNAVGTFNGVRDALLHAGLPAPDAPGGIAEGPLRVGVFMGLAAEEGYWNFDHQAFAPLASFLRLLAQP